MATFYPPGLRRRGGGLGGGYVEEVESRVGPFRSALGGLASLGRGVARAIAAPGAPGSPASEIFGPLGYGPGYMHPRERRFENDLAALFADDPEGLAVARVSPELALRRAEREDERAYERDQTEQERAYLDRVREAQFQHDFNLLGRRSRLTGEPMEVYVNGELRQITNDGAGTFTDVITGQPVDPRTVSFEPPADVDGMPAEELRIADTEARATNLLGAIDRAREQSTPATTGIRGKIGRWLHAASLGGQPSADLAATIDEIQAYVGFAELQRMRDNSKTGGALGQVSNREIQLLTAALGSLEQSQSEAQFERNLERVLNQIVGSAEQVRAAYVADYGREPPPSELFRTADEIRASFAAGREGDAPPLSETARARGVTAAEWANMTPEERALFRDQPAAPSNRFNLDLDRAMR